MNSAEGGRRYLLLIYDDAIPEGRVEVPAIEESGRGQMQPPIPSKRERGEARKIKRGGGEVGSVSYKEVSQAATPFLTLVAA
jgi:hypothetical protein